MRTYLISALVAAALALPSMAFAQDITRDFDHEYDFSKLKTFTVKVGTSWGNALSETRVSDDVAEALSQKGWKRVPEESADAVAVLHGATQTKHNVSTFYSGYGGGGWGYSGFEHGSSNTMVSEYRVGTLVVDIFDAKTKKLVYRGSASDEISDNPEKNVKKSEKATQKMFKDFPPKPKKS